MNGEDPENFNPKVLRYHSLRRTNDDLEEVMRNHAFISPLMRDSHWDGYRWESTKKKVNTNPMSLMRRQNHTKTNQDNMDDIRAASEPRSASNGYGQVRFNPQPTTEPVEPSSISLFSQRRSAMNRFLKGTPKLSTTPRPRVTSLEAIAADVVSREDKHVSHFEKISRLSSSVLSDKLRWTKQRQSGDIVVRKEHFHEINKKELPRYEHNKSTLTFSGRNARSTDAYTKRRNLADVKNKLREIKHMNKEHREHLADISILSEEIEYDRKQVEMERHIDSHTAQSAIRQKKYTAELIARRRHHHHAPARSNARFAVSDENLNQQYSPSSPETVMGNSFSNSTRQQYSPESTDDMFSPPPPNGYSSNSRRDLTGEVAKALQAAAEARAALEREVVERAMAENAANEKLEKEARVSASLREEVVKLHNANQEADRERRAQREEIRELRQSMNDLRASLSELIPGEVAELRATVTNLRASMVDLMGDARARLAREDAEAVWKYLQNFMETDRHAEDILSELDQACDGRVDRHSFAEFLRETGAESINSTVTTEVFRMAQKSGDADRPYLSWVDFIDMLRPHRSRVPTPPLRESSLSRQDDNFDAMMASQSFGVGQSFGQENQQLQQSLQGEEMIFFRANFPPGSIGLSFMNIDEQEGIVVTHCEGAAMTAGVLAGDVIVEVNEEPLDSDFTEDNLFDLLMELPRPISIGFKRPAFDQSNPSITLREDQEDEERERQEEEERNNPSVLSHEQEVFDRSEKNDVHNDDFEVVLDKDLSNDDSSALQNQMRNSNPLNTSNSMHVSKDDIASSSSSRHHETTANVASGVDLKVELSREENPLNTMTLSLDSSDIQDRNLRFSLTDDFRDDLPSDNDGEEQEEDTSAIEFSPTLHVENDEQVATQERENKAKSSEGNEKELDMVVDIDHSREVDLGLVSDDDSENEEGELEFSQVVGEENMELLKSQRTNEDEEATVEFSPMVVEDSENNSDNESVSSEISMDEQSGKDKVSSSQKKKNKKKRKGKK